MVKCKSRDGASLWDEFALFSWSSDGYFLHFVAYYDIFLSSAIDIELLFDQISYNISYYFQTSKQ